jgi:hypothetical protein
MKRGVTMPKQLNYAPSDRKQEPLWWRVTEIGLYVTLGLLALTVMMGVAVWVQSLMDPFF